MKVYFEIIAAEGLMHVENYFDMPAVPRSGDTLVFAEFQGATAGQCTWFFAANGPTPWVEIDGGDEYSKEFHDRLLKAGWKDKYDK
jgi:hypothetical protein